MPSKLSKNLKGQKMFQILNQVQELERKGKKIYHFELGEPFHRTPKSIPERMIKSIQKGNTKYTSSFGNYELRECIVNTTKKTRGFQPDIDQVLITTGANSIIYYLIKILCNPGDEVIIPSPGFPTYISASKANGVKIKYLKLNEKNNYQIEIQEVKKLISKKTKLMIVNSPSNPTGVIQTKETLVSLYNLIKGYNNLFLLSDEIYSRITLDKNKFFSLSSLDKCLSKVVVLNGFSKAFSMTGYRIGCAIGPKNLIEKMRLLSETIVSCVPPFIQDACITAIKLNKKFLEKDLLDYINKRNFIVKKFRKTKLIFAEPNGGFYIFPSLKNYSINSEIFCNQILKKYGIALVPGNNFGVNCKYNFRLAFTSSFIDLKYSINKIVLHLNSYEN